MKIVLKDLTKEFASRDNDKKSVIAVNNFNIEIPDGKLIALLGPSGCGKSTTLNLISGLEKPTRGKIFFGDTDVTDYPPEARGIGMVFQNYALYPHLTVKQNIMFPLENLKGDKKLSKEVMLEKVVEAAKLVQLEELLDRKPAELSGGQQQRVAIARALVKMPSVLLLDEPLSNLDARLRLQTREEIRRIQKETKITTIFVTHDQEEAMSISDYIIVMKDGIIQQVGKPQEVYENPINLFVAKFLGTPAINVFNGTVKDHKLYIGNQHVLDTTSDVDDQDVYVGIRPEGFVVNDSGEFTCNFNRIETQGRDTTIVVNHPECISAQDIRAIVPSDVTYNVKDNKISFSLKESRTYIFSKEDEKAL